MNKNEIGLYGERQAARFLRDKGYKIISANYRTRLGEIDIVASKGKFIAFIEVKTRGENSIALPREFVDRSKQNKIITAAETYLAGNSTKLQPRFDIIEVYLDKDKKQKSINHIKDAFQGD